MSRRPCLEPRKSKSSPQPQMLVLGNHLDVSQTASLPLGLSTQIVYAFVMSLVDAACPVAGFR